MSAISLCRGSWRSTPRIIRGSSWCRDGTGVVELADLGSDAFPLTAEIGVVSLALKELTRCDKINIAAIGNVVPQLHVHIVARRKTDPLWPKPVFGVMPLPRAKDAAFERFVDKVRKKLGAAQVS